MTGNASSWIGNSADTFAGIKLGASTWLGRIAFGRDVAGGYTDRTFGTYTLQYTQAANPGAATPETETAATGWQTIGNMIYGGAGGANYANPSQRHVFSFTPVQATGVRLRTFPSNNIPDWWICLDEIELYGPGLTSFAGPGGITINDNAPASPSPSTITVSGVAGTITAVRVKLNGFSHTWPNDVDMFLVSPGGQVCAVMSDAGGENPGVTGANLVIEDAAANDVPAPLAAGTWRPTSLDPGEPLPPGGTGSIGTSLMALAAGTVNGDWKLFVSDDVTQDSGSITSWALEFETAGPPLLAQIALEQPAGTPLESGTSSVSFDAVEVSPAGTAAKTFTLRNTGTASLTVSGVAVTGGAAADYAVNTTGMLTSVPAGDSTQFTVTFDPSALGIQATTLRVTSNSSVTPVFDVSLTGTGQDTIPPVVSVTTPVPIVTTATGPGGAVVGFNYNTNDAVGVADVQVEPPNGSLFPPGQTLVTITATDFAGNTGSATFTVTVLVPNPVVTTLADENDTVVGPATSLREAVRFATAGSTITFAPALAGQTITLGSELVLAKNVVIDASNLPGGLTLSGNHAHRIFTVNSGQTVALRGLTLTDGNAIGGAGGAILNTGGTVTLTQCTVSGNSADLVGGGIYIGGGTLTLTQCTVSSNTSSLAGGGIYNIGVTLLTQCTVSSNTSSLGGGIYNVGSTLTLENSIVAGNTVGGLGSDILNDAAPITRTGVNFIGNTADSGLTASATLLTGDPRLAPLADNGGPTKTMALLAGSPALDAATVLPGLDTDQRGFPRNRDGDAIAGALPDLGAYEAQVAPLPFRSVGFNFVGGGGGGPGGTPAATDVAGAPGFRQAHWNNLQHFYDGVPDGAYSHGPVPLKDAAGNNFSPNLRLWWAAPQLWSRSGDPTTPDEKLMWGYLDSNGAIDEGTDLFDVQAKNQPFFAVADLPPALTLGGYQVLVYADGAGNAHVSEYWLASNRGTNPANVSGESDLTPHRFRRDDTDFSGTYTEVPAGSTTDLGAATPQGNVLRFGGLVEPGFTVRSREGGFLPLNFPRAEINAVQIVRNEILVVTIAADENDPNGTLGTGLSLREALRDAPDGAGIIFDPALNGATLTLGSQLVLAKSVVIDASNLPAGLTLSGNHAHRIFTVNTGQTVALRGLTLTEGNAGDGGAIYNLGALTLTQCTVSGNSSVEGGGIANYGGTLTLTQCTLSGNTAQRRGGGIANYGDMVTLTQCTVSGNIVSVGDGGGGILNSGGTLTLKHCTVSSNSASYSGGGLANWSGSVTLANSIVAGNTASTEGPDITNNGTITPTGVNFIGDNATVATIFPEGPLVGTTANPKDPRLGPLANYGGPTMTMALLPDSTAINAAVGSTITSDQRGFPIFGVPDIGAYEAQAPPTVTISPHNPVVLAGNLLILTATPGEAGLSFQWKKNGVPTGVSTQAISQFFTEADDGSTYSVTVTRTSDFLTASDSVTVTVLPPLIVTSTADSGPGSLRQTLANAAAHPGADTITFAPALSGQSIVLITFADAGFGPTALTVADADGVTLDATALPAGLTLTRLAGPSGNGYRAFFVGIGGSLTLRGLTLSGFSSGDFNGGAIANQGGTLTLTQCSLAGNSSADYGGAIYNETGTLTLSQCSLFGNSAHFGGAIASPVSTVTLTQCSFSGNTADRGGAIDNELGTLTLTQCSLSGNSADRGGAIYSRTVAIAGSTTLRHCTIAGNSAPAGQGSGVASDGDTNTETIVQNSIISGNTGTSVDFSGATNSFTSLGGNLIGNGNAIGDFNQPGDLINDSPLLSPLGNYGGPTRTMPPLAGSPAIDAATVLSPALNTDQRGFPFIGTPDIGACEASLADTLTVTATGDSGPGSLRTALASAAAHPGADTITFAPALSGQSIVLNGVADATSGASALTVADADGVTLDATALPAGLTLTRPAGPSGNGYRAFFVGIGSNLTLRGLTLSGFSAQSGYEGGAIFNGSGTLTLTQCSLSGNSAVYGGAIFNINGTLTLTQCTLTGNTAIGSGGGIFSEGAVTMTGCTLSGNSANGSGGAIKISNQGSAATLTQCTLAGNSAGNGGGISSDGAVTMTGCTLSGNSANISGGAMRLSDIGQATTLTQCTFSGNTGAHGGAIFNQRALNMVQSTLVGNHATNQGGAIYNQAGSLTLTNSIVAGNSAVTSGPDISNEGTVTRTGANLLGSAINHVLAGSDNGPPAIIAEPRLSPLGNYGGPTKTMLPRPDSPALDRIASTTLTTDQRGYPRTMWGKVDIGAVEAGIGADCAWEVREIYRSPATPVVTLADAEALAADTVATSVTSTLSVINFADPETNPDSGGFFTGDVPFVSNNQTPQGAANGDDDDFVTVARSFFTVTAEDDYTFGFSSDDGARLRIFGADFTGSTRLNPANPADPAHSGNTLTYDGLTGRSDTLGVCHLTPGTYALEFLAWERGGGACAEVFAARGAKTAVDNSFRLIGDTATGASLTVGTLAAGWNVDVIRNGAASLDTAVQQVQSLWCGATQPNTTSVTDVPGLNYYDPESGGGGHGQAQTAFPGNLPGDDNFFALGARATLTVPVEGDYTFHVLGDDGIRFRIAETRGWSASGGAGAVAMLDGFAAPGCCGDAFGYVHLRAGTWQIEFIFNEIASGAYAGLWAAPGRQTRFEPAVFSLVGGPGVGAPPFVLSPSGLPAPVNDAFANALPLTGMTAAGTACNTGGTVEAGEPVPYGGNSSITNSLWWKWTAPATGKFRFDTNGSEAQTYFALYGVTSSPDINAVAPVSPGYLGATLDIYGGYTYLIQVFPAEGATGRVRLNIEPRPPDPVPPPPANDQFADATHLGSGSTVFTAGTTAGATTEQGEPGFAHNSVWYSWTAPWSGDFAVDTHGSRTFTWFAVYAGATPASRVLLAGASSDWPNMDGAHLTFSATAGVTYRIVVDRSLGSGGPFFLNITPVPAITASALNPAGDTLTVTWQSEPGVSYRLEQSANLTTWTPAARCGGSNSATTELDLIFPAAQPRLFLRILRE